MGFVLSAFQMGSVPTQLLGGILAERYGGKWVVSCSVLVSGLVAFLIPMMARAGLATMILARVLQGLSMGMNQPAVYSMSVPWIPLTEKNRIMSFINAGGKFGNLLGMTLTGVLSEAFGWESSFYVMGAVSCAWFACFAFLCYDSPEQHPRISEVCWCRSKKLTYVVITNLTFVRLSVAS